MNNDRHPFEMGLIKRIGYSHMQELIRKPKKGYMGHRNWNHYNVYHWLINDEKLYDTAIYLLSQYSNCGSAARRFVWDKYDNSIRTTPDGAPYTEASVSAALSLIKKQIRDMKRAENGKG